MKKSMKIGFLLGSPDISGGTYVIYEHGTRLLELGHHVTMITKRPVTSDDYCWHQRAQELSWLTVDEAVDVYFDIVISTWWQSPFLLPRLKSDHYVYFVQSIESRFFEQEDPTQHDRRDLDIYRQYCESTYTLNLPVITEAQWICDYLFDNYNRSPFLVRNGIRKDIYQEEGVTILPRTPGKLRVLVEGPVDVHFKNVPKSVELCKEAGIDEIWLLTSSGVKAFPGVDRVFSRVSIHQTSEIYRSCDVLVKLSYIEGMFGPPLEMFHCGGTAIVYDVTGHDEYIVHDENSYVVPKDMDDQVVDYLKRLKDEPKTLKRLKTGAMKTAESWPDWQDSSALFELVLQQISDKQKTNRNYLKNWIEKLEKESLMHKVQRLHEQFKQREEISCGDVTGIEQNNFIQVYYWAEEDGLCPENFTWAHYLSGGDNTLTVKVPITGLPFWIRIDPSVRIGIIILNSITITNRPSKKLLARYDGVESMSSLYAGGTIRRLQHTEKVVFLSTGDDPQLILPAISKGEIGDELEIEISLKEMGVAEYFESLEKKYRLEVAANKPSATLIQKIRAQLSF